MKRVKVRHNFNPVWLIPGITVALQFRFFHPPAKKKRRIYRKQSRPIEKNFDAGYINPLARKRAGRSLRGARRLHGDNDGFSRF
ncbi:hypothetical protein [uncultured Victivallis sp.]|uniref:hypothetical protein n=1 Tax=uncultured Victivallis sp. TaxID=354118 RepID=UPI0025D9D36F|nr:hypothetical protein [uncultured Victivallis sp.]